MFLYLYRPRPFTSILPFYFAFRFVCRSLVFSAARLTCSMCPVRLLCLSLGILSTHLLPVLSVVCHACLRLLTIHPGQV